MSALSDVDSFVQGNYDEAEVLLLRSLKIFEEVFGYDHPNVASALNNHANVLVYQVKFRHLQSDERPQGKYDEAKSAYMRSLEIREQMLGNDHPDVAAVLINIASLLEDQVGISIF